MSMKNPLTPAGIERNRKEEGKKRNKKKGIERKKEKGKERKRKKKERKRPRRNWLHHRCLQTT